jgi:hypothetical protein
MTTFTTEDRLIAEQNGSVTINVEPIPFAGLVTITEKPKYKDLTDEEIMVLYEEYIETQYASESNVLGFGRAILRKAQEK